MASLIEARTEFELAQTALAEAHGAEAAAGFRAWVNNVKAAETRLDAARVALRDALHAIPVSDDDALERGD